MNTLVSKVRANWKSGLTVSLVSIPLSISLAVASGSTPVIGIITAIWAGLFASIFGGSNYNIVGPTGALSGIIISYSLINGASSMAIVAIIAGLFILLAWLLHLEKYLILIPSSVVNGFTLGVAFIIAFNQFNYALGLYGLPKHETFFANLVESFKHVGSASLLSLAVFIIFLTALILLKKYIPKVPGAMLLSPVGILLGYLSITNLLPFKLVTLGNLFNNLNFYLFELPHFSFSYTMISAAAAIALVAILETMLSAKIADGMTHTKHNEHKEMFGLGMANIASGFMGGLPATAALARTSLNVKIGSTNKMSATISSIFIAVISIFLLSYFSYIPMAVIAAILVYVAIQMIEKENYVKYYQCEKTSFFVALLVAFITVYKDPMIGIVFGTAISLLLFVERLSRGDFSLKINRFEDGLIDAFHGDKMKEIKEDGDILLYSIRGKLCYINNRAHIARFEDNFVDYKTIILRFREVYFMDIDGAETIDELIRLIEGRGQKVILSGLHTKIANLLRQVSPRYCELEKEGKIFKKTRESLLYAGIKEEQLF
jgi:SulP family sulfate permease